MKTYIVCVCMELLKGKDAEVPTIIGQDFDYNEVAAEVVQPLVLVGEIIPGEITVQMLGLIFCHL